MRSFILLLFLSLAAFATSDKYKESLLGYGSFLYLFSDSCQYDMEANWVDPGTKEDLKIYKFSIGWNSALRGTDSAMASKLSVAKDSVSACIDRLEGRLPQLDFCQQRCILDNCEPKFIVYHNRKVVCDLKQDSGGCSTEQVVQRECYRGK